ncbi:MAG: transposase domain-containing protein [Magnetovibrionaceae bacterium]
MTEWFSIREVVEALFPSLIGLPSIEGKYRALNARARREGWDDRQNRRGEPLCRRREGKGGGRVYHYSVFDRETQTALMAQIKAEPQTGTGTAKQAAMWLEYEALDDKKKAVAMERLEFIREVEVLVRGGCAKNLAISELCKDRTVNGRTPSVRTVYNWFDAIEGLDSADHLPPLAPRNQGRALSDRIGDEAWDFFRSDWLRLARPNAASCHRRLVAAAKEHGWGTIPPVKHFIRKIEHDIPLPVQVLAREGEDAVKKLYPAQERDRSHLHALEAVNADGHRFDVFVEWPDGKVERPCMTAIQDLYSGMILAWRIDRSENKEAVLLAVGDMVTDFGIPKIIYLDNGRNFASKWLTGGMPNRYRFKVKDNEPAGLLKCLDVEVSWTTPYSGQSKPIERAFKDLCEDVSKHPKFDGAYTGNSPTNKPANYGERAVPIDTFLKILAEGVTEHNQREGRRSKNCGGRSFAQTFSASYAISPIKKAVPEQARLWLLAAEGVKAQRPDGAIKHMGNRFWAPFLNNHIGKELTIRFDPENLSAGLHVYRLDGCYLGFAEIIEAVGFNDASAAREHNRARRDFIKALKLQRDAQQRLSPEEVAAKLPTTDELPLPEAKIVKMATFDSKEIMRREPDAAEPLTEAQQEIQTALIEDLESHRAKPAKETAGDRYLRAIQLESDLAEGLQVDKQKEIWLRGYRKTNEYRTQKMLAEIGSATA